MKSQKVSFSNPDGEQLSGRLDLPDEGHSRGLALFAHCFTCSKNLNAVTRISKTLTSLGLAVFRFDFTGLGESGGDFAASNFSSNVADLLQAAAYLAEHHRSPDLLIGHSLGGAAVLRAAASLPEVRAVVTIAAPADPVHLKHLFKDQHCQVEKEGQAQVILGGREFTIRKQFLQDLDAQEMAKHIRQLKKALLIFHGPLDETVGIENAAKIFEVAKHPKSFISLDGADHLLSKAEDAAYVASVMAAWVSRYLAKTQANG